MVIAGQKRKHMETFSAASDSPGARKSVDVSAAQQAAFLIDQGAKPAPTHEFDDVIDLGFVTVDQASVMFDCYVENMAPHMPAVVFKAGTTMAEIRKTKPTLFLAILAASSGSSFPNVQKQLTKEVMANYAEKIILKGEKTLELVQALQVSSLWYYPPEHFEELKFYQLIHIALVMAIDIGLGKRSKVKGPGLWRDYQWRRTPYPDPTGLEARRAWLGCYFLCCNAAMGLRRPHLIQWSPFMDDCVQVLETSPDAAPSDRALCAWVRIQHIAEEVGKAFSMDDPNANVSMNDLNTSPQLKGFENRLADWSKQVLPAVESRRSS
jgi:Fungal specific transcription factor domain